MDNGYIGTTRTFSESGFLREKKTQEIIKNINTSLISKGYNPLNQIVGYIMSGDPTYITSHNNARNYITQIELDELVEEIVNFYIKHNC